MNHPLTPANITRQNHKKPPRLAKDMNLNERTRVKYKSLVLAFWAIAICSVSSCGGSDRAEVEKLTRDQFVSEDVFLSITNGASLAEVRKTLGTATRHEFTVADGGHIWTLIMCYLDTGAEESYTYYQLLFRDGSLVKTIRWIEFEREEYSYEGTTATRSKPWDIEDMKYVKKAIKAPAVTPEQIRAEMQDARETMEKYKGTGNIPAVVGNLFAPAMLANAREQVPINEKLREKFDGTRASPGMTVKEVDALYGEPLYTFITKSGGSARIYGDNVNLSSGVDAFLVFSFVAARFDSGGHATGIYSDPFLCEDWYPDMPSWRRQ